MLEESSVAKLIHLSRQAISDGNFRAARRAAEQAAQSAPHMEQPWLLLAALSSPKGVEYFLNKALALNPASPYAKLGLQWLEKKLSEKSGHLPTLAELLFPELVKKTPQQSKRSPTLYILTACLVLVILATLGFSTKLTEKPTPSDGAHQFAVATLTAFAFQSTQTPSPTLTLSPSPSSTPTVSITPTLTSSPSPSRTPTSPPTATTTNPPPPTETRDPTHTKPAPTANRPTNYTVKSGDTLSAIASRFGISITSLMNANRITNASKIHAGQVLIIPGSGSNPPQPQIPTSVPPPSGGKLILIDISEQHLYAYEESTLIFSFVASTGIGNSTRIGTFKVLDKIPNAFSQSFNIWMPYWMGIYYSGTLENGIHGLPKLWNGVELWGNLLGKPATYGCIETRTNEAKLLYDWAEIGTKVVIRP